MIKTWHKTEREEGSLGATGPWGIISPWVNFQGVIMHLLISFPCPVAGDIRPYNMGNRFLLYSDLCLRQKKSCPCQIEGVEFHFKKRHLLD